MIPPGPILRRAEHPWGQFREPSNRPWWVRLDALVLQDGAPISEAKVAALAADLVLRGQQRPLSVIRVGEACWLAGDGAHRVTALRRLGEVETAPNRIATSRSLWDQRLPSGKLGDSGICASDSNAGYLRLS